MCSIYFGNIIVHGALSTDVIRRSSSFSGASLILIFSSRSRVEYLWVKSFLWYGACTVTENSWFFAFDFSLISRYYNLHNKSLYFGFISISKFWKVNGKSHIHSTCFLVFFAQYLSSVITNITYRNLLGIVFNL